MPRVPTLQANRVQQTAMPNIRVQNVATAETFGGGQSAQNVMSAFQGVADKASKIFQEEKQAADKIKVSEALDSALRQKNTMLHDPKSGALMRRGQDAFGVMDEVSPAYAKYLKETEESLSNQEQKDQFRAMARDIHRDLDGSLMGHIGQETIRHEVEVNKSLVASLQEDAILNYKDPNKIQSALMKQEAQIRSQRGISPEAAELEVMEARSKTHAAIIDRMLSEQNDTGASAYFKAVESQISPSLVTKLKGALEEGNLRGQSQRISESLVAKHTDLASALKAVDKYDGKLEDEIRRRVKERFSEQESAQQLTAKQAYHEAYRIAETQMSKDAIPPGLWNQLTPENKNAINSFLSKPDQPADLGLYYDLKTMAANPETRNDFKQLDLMKYKHKLGETFKELVNFQASLEKGDTKGADGVLKEMQVINSVLEQNGFTAKDKEKNALFRERVDKEVIAFHEHHNRKPNNNELRDIAHALMVDTVTHDGWLWDTKKRGFELTDEDVPAEDRKQIEAALRKRKVPATADRIMQMYKRMKEARVNQ